MTCPLCKRRLGIWCRRNANNLVNQKLWEEIQRRFPDLAAGKELDEEQLQDLFPCVPVHQHAEAGDIAKEFEEHGRTIRSDLEERTRREEEASREMIRRIQEEEGALPSQDTTAQATPNEEAREEETIIRDGEVNDEASCSVENVPPEALRDRERAFEAIRQIKADEEIARRLQADCDGERPVLKAKRASSQTRTTTPARTSSQKASPGGSAKKFKQLSLFESFKEKGNSTQ